MGASPPKSIRLGPSTSSRISSLSLIASPNWALEKSFGTNGSGATRCSKKAGTPENQNPECGARPRDLSGTNAFYVTEVLKYATACRSFRSPCPLVHDIREGESHAARLLAHRTSLPRYPLISRWVRAPHKSGLSSFARHWSCDSGGSIRQHAYQLRFCSSIIHRSISSRLKRQSEPTRNAGNFCSRSSR